MKRFKAELVQKSFKLNNVGGELSLHMFFGGGVI